MARCSLRPSTRLTELFAADAHVEVEAAWGIYQQIAGYREPDRTRGRELMRQLIESISRL